MANSVTISGADTLDQVLGALDEQLAARGAAYDLVVVGGSALLALDLVHRPTKDVDVVAFRHGVGVRPPTPFPAALESARAQVARDLGLSANWINGGPASLLDFGLPDGLVDRLVRRRYGPALTVSFASRLDQIHFKLYATVDQGPGKHFRDLRELEPTSEELLAAARWSRTHDPSEGYRQVLVQALAQLGVPDADVGP